ncbi:MAG: hypothetical protein WAS51_10280 [Ilumatobacteraceae bacterium]|nr:MAG: zf-TFIIB domain-containing protein [Actinomycetota bacterium]
MQQITAGAPDPSISGISSIFAAPCPRCGADLMVVDGTTRGCPNCGGVFRHSLGHLVPLAASESI